MPDAIVDAVYYDETIRQHCICASVQDGRDGPFVVLYYVQSGATPSVPLDVFKETDTLDVRHVPGEPEPS